MRRLILPGLLLHLLLLPSAATGQPPPAERSSACETLESCIAELLAAGRSRRQVSEEVRTRLASFGDQAVDALVPLLMHPNLEVRGSAGLALAGFRSIEPRHLPALVEAWRRGDTVNNQGRGNGWMPRAVAATGTEEALRVLWKDFERDPRQSSNAQVLFALARFGERLRPRVQARMHECAAGWNDRCMGVVELLFELDGRWPPPNPPVIPPWAEELLVAWTGAEAPETRGVAAETLGRLRHPAGREPLQRELEALVVETGSPDSQWQARHLIGQIARYGPAAAGSGPTMARYLDARFDEDLRAEAALALGAIGDSSGTAALLALEPALRDDWLLAYNVAESLGRLRSEAARPLLDRLAKAHWHKGVRNNAARALNMIAGGPFARPNVPADGDAYPQPRDDEGNEYLYMGDLRYAGDDAPRWCGRSDDGHGITFPQDPVGRIEWPRRRGAELEFESVGEARQRDIRRRIPVRQVQGSTVAVLPVPTGLLVAFNGGEFGGGLYHLPRRGPARPLLGEPVVGAWLMGGRLYVAAGLAHLVLDRGHLYVVHPRRLRVERIVRLPASPWRLAVSSRKAVIVKTAQGHVAVGEDGRLIDPQRIGDCDSDRSGE